MTKTKAAFLMTCDRLFASYPKVYFWTFTWKKVWNDWDYPHAWRGFIRDLNDRYGHYICGIRVLEPHVSHGLHYHMLCNLRVSVWEVRRIGKQYGIGRVHVDKAGPHSAMYLSKYLNKDSPKLHGVSRWHTVGPFVGVNVNQIIIESDYMNARRKVVVEQLPFGYEELLHRVFDLHGEYGLKVCYDFLKQGMTGHACLCYSPHVQLTPKGGLVSRRPIGLKYDWDIHQGARGPILYRCVKAS
jgi:hypothetical protein